MNGFGNSPDGIGAAPAADSPYYPMQPGTPLELVPKFMPPGVLGQPAPDSLWTYVVVSQLISAGAGTVVGMAVAPSRDKRTKYALVGGLLGLFLGPIGIGAQALYALGKD